MWLEEAASCPVGVTVLWVWLEEAASCPVGVTVLWVWLEEAASCPVGVARGDNKLSCGCDWKRQVLWV